MPYALRQSTASQEVPIGKFVSTADGDTPMTGLTINASDIRLYKNGSSAAVSKNSGGASHDEAGVYIATLDATDTNTIGPLIIFVHVATAFYVKVECEVLDEAVFDVKYGTVKPQTTADAVASVTGNVGGNVAGSVGSVTGNVGGNVAGSIGSLGATAKSDVNAEVVDVINTDTSGEPGQGAPPAAASLRTKVDYLFKYFRNRKRQTTTQFELYADDGTTVDQKATISKTTGVGVYGEMVTGP